MLEVQSLSRMAKQVVICFRMALGVYCRELQKILPLFTTSYLIHLLIKTQRHGGCLSEAPDAGLIGLAQRDCLLFDLLLNKSINTTKQRTTSLT